MIDKNNDRHAGNQKFGFATGKQNPEPETRAILKQAGLTLEEIVYKSNEIGMQLATQKHHAEKMEILKPVVRAKIMTRLDDGKISETKLRRLCEIDPEYIAHLEKLSECRYQADRLKIRYDSYKNLFEAKRSELSYKKAEMQLI